MSFESPLASPAGVQRRFTIDEYERFYEVLSPLHDVALTQNDLPQIRATAKELVARGEAIIKLGVPEAPRANRRAFAKARNGFKKTLKSFSGRAKKGEAEEVKESLVALSQSFEKLVDLLPSVYPRGDPPNLIINCPSGAVRAGSEVQVTADIPEEGEFVFVWRVTPAKIIKGDGTRTITIDTTGLQGQTIEVTVDASDGNGHIVPANCKFFVK